MGVLSINRALGGLGRERASKRLLGVREAGTRKPFTPTWATLGDSDRMRVSDWGRDMIEKALTALLGSEEEALHGGQVQSDVTEMNLGY